MDFRRHLIGCSVALAATLAAVSAQAQLRTGPVDLQTFRPAADSKGYITLNGAQILAPLDISFGLVSTGAWKPLVLESHWRDNEDSAVKVKYLMTTSLQAAVGLFETDHIGLQVGFVLPMGVLSGEGTPYDPVNDRTVNDDVHYKMSVQSLGDLVIHPKLRLVNPSRKMIGLAIIPSIVLPTGDKNGFMGEGRTIFQPSLVVDANWGRFGVLRTAINVGARLRSKAAVFRDEPGSFPRPVRGEDPNTYLGIKADKELLAGFGVAWGVVPFHFDLVGEFYTFTGLGSKKIDVNGAESAMKPGGEAVAGIKLYLASNSFFEAGAGYGVMPSSYGTSRGRFFVGFIFEPNVGDRDGDGYKDDVDQCPDDPEDFDDFEDSDGCPDPDNDKDRILDVDDSCPNDPETYNGYKDEDGCPDGVVRDRDGDGIPDDMDRCPDEPEDKDGFEDEDGCPDLDNDKDGILDKVDLCPNDPEDFDGFEDKDGCPDLDNDRDRIPDTRDKCPNEPETYNGNEDEDGCPDKGMVVVTQAKLEIMDKIYFETDKDVIREVSFPLLDAIAATIKGHPEIRLIEIQGHADERGDDEHNLDLTDRRAHAVQLALEDRGVDLGRLRARGYGETKPICTQHNEDCWSKNRRVEFIILQRQNEQVLQDDAGQ